MSRDNQRFRKIYSFYRPQNRYGIEVVDADIIKSLDWKQHALVATTGPITLVAPGAIDDVTLSDGNRVLVKDQADATQNGIYYYSADISTLLRDADAVDPFLKPATAILVEKGTANQDCGFVLTTDGPITVGTTELTWVKAFKAGSTLAAGLDTYVQFNDGGVVLGGTADFTFNKTTKEITMGGDLAVNGGNLTTTAATATLFNTNATTVNIAGAASTAMSLGNIDGTNTISGKTKFSQGLSGSLTQLTDGKSYLVAGSNVTITSGSNGQVTVATSLTPGGLDTYVQFNDGGSTFGGDSGLTYNKTTDTLTVTGDVAVNGGNLTTTAATATLFNTNATTVNIAAAASTAFALGNALGTNTISGKTKFTQGLSGSLTQLTDGTSYLVAGNNISITSGSNGQVTVTSTGGAPGGLDTYVQFNDGGSTLNGTSDFTFNKNTKAVTLGGSLAVNGGAISTSATTATIFNTTATTVNIAGGATTSTTIGNATGGVNLNGAVTATGNVAANGGSLTTTAATANLFNATATTVNIAGGATASVNLGNIVGTNNIAGASKFAQGLSGSLTTLTDGTSYLIAGTGISITSGSNGPVTISQSVRTPLTYNKLVDSAAVSSDDGIIVVAPAAMTLSSIKYVPDNSLTANDTNYATITFYKYTSGALPGTTIASATTKTSASGGTGNWTSFTPVTITISVSSVSSGDVIYFGITKANAGVVIPKGTFVINYTM